MAKRKQPDMSDIFAKTEPDQSPAEQPPDPAKPRGIGLKQSEWAHIDEIANELGMTPHALAVWALRNFIQRYTDGEIKTQTKKSLPDL